MSEQLYRVCWQVAGYDIVYGNPQPKKNAEDEAAVGNSWWAWTSKVKYWVEPVLPDWTPPTVTRIPLERTMMGSPCMGGDDDLDLLGVKPPC